MFERFYRGDERLSRRTEGTGLGLALVRHLVVGMHGQVSIDPTYRGGARFEVRLPAA